MFTAADASALRVAYYAAVGAFAAYGFQFAPAYAQVERDFRVVVEADLARRYGANRFVSRFNV